MGKKIKKIKVQSHRKIQEKLKRKLNMRGKLVILLTLLLAIGLGACKDECEEVNADEKCIKNITVQDLEYFTIDADSVASSPITIVADERVCQSLDFGPYRWVAQNSRFRFEGDFEIDPCERNPDIIMDVDFLRMDFRDSILGQFTFDCQKQEHPDSLFLQDSITGNIGIEDISSNVRLSAFASDLVELTQTSTTEFSFVSTEANPTLTGTYNDNTKEINFTRVFLNNIGVNETCNCTGVKN